MVGNDVGLPPQYVAVRHAGGGQQQVQKQTDGQRQRVGLMPTDGQDAYKRSSMRASKRSRADRLSYLVATGHINKEEAQELCIPLDEADSIRNNSNNFENNSENKLIHNSQFNHNYNNSSNINQLPYSYISNNNNNNNNNNSIMTTPMMITTNPTSTSSAANISGDQALLDYVSSASVTPDNFKINSQKIKKNLKVRLPTDNRGQFRRTRTEVTLPMKTSPAFEYILKDRGRRNRRCFLWLIYSLLMAVGLTIIVFCSAQLVIRYQQNHHP